MPHIVHCLHMCFKQLMWKIYVQFWNGLGFICFLWRCHLCNAVLACCEVRCSLDRVAEETCLSLFARWQNSCCSCPKKWCWQPYLAYRLYCQIYTLIIVLEEQLFRCATTAADKCFGRVLWSPYCALQMCVTLGVGNLHSVNRCEKCDELFNESLAKLFLL